MVVQHTAAVLGERERGWTWRSHTGYLFKWAPWNSWVSKAPGSGQWVDLVIREAITDERTPFVAVGCGGTGTCAIGIRDTDCPNCLPASLT